MMRTVTHEPDRITTLTFPAESKQHQLTILTLATHLLFSVPTLHTRASWDIIRHPSSHKHTLHLILATVTLKHYHKIWFTALGD